MKTTKHPFTRLPTISPRKIFTGDLRSYMDALMASAAQVAKHLDVSERSVLRWLAENSAPRPVLLALWYETPEGRAHVTGHSEFGMQTLRGLARSAQEASSVQAAQVARLLAISETGAANDALLLAPGGCYSGQPRPTALSSTFSHLETAPRSTPPAARPQAR